MRSDLGGMGGGVAGTTVGAHRGAIFALLFLDESEWGPGYGIVTGNGGGPRGLENHALLASASADRTVKLWDVFGRDLAPKQRCVQTLVGHSGSVTALSFLRGSLITASTDGTLRIWRSAADRNLLLYPFFEVVQEIGSVPPPVPNSVLGLPGVLGIAAEMAAAQVQRPGRGKMVGASPNTAAGSAGTAGGSGSSLHSNSLTAAALSSSPTAAGSSAGSCNFVLKSCPVVVGRLVRAETQLLFVGDTQGRVYTFSPPQRGGLLGLSTGQGVVPSLPPVARAHISVGDTVPNSPRYPAPAATAGASASAAAGTSSAAGATAGGSLTLPLSSRGSAAGSAAASRPVSSRPGQGLSSAASSVGAGSMSNLASGSGSGFSPGSGGGSGSGGFDFLHASKIHALSLSTLLIIHQESLIVTLSFDHTVQVHDCVSGAGYFGMENPNRCRYLGAAWDSTHQELFLSDAKGYVQVWNIYIEKCIKNVRIAQGPINSLSLHQTGSGPSHHAHASSAVPSTKLLVGSATGVEIWSIHRQVRFNEFRGHDQAVIGLVQVRTQSLSQVNTKHLRMGKKFRPLEGGGGAADGAEEGSNAGSPHRKPPRRTMPGEGGDDIDGLVPETKASEDDGANEGELIPEGMMTASSTSSLSSNTLRSPRSQALQKGQQSARARDRDREPEFTSILSEENYLYSASLDYSIRCWDTSDMSCLSIIQERHSEISSLIAIPNSVILVSGHDDGSVRMWNMDSGSFMKSVALTLKRRGAAGSNDEGICARRADCMSVRLRTLTLRVSFSFCSCFSSFSLVQSTPPQEHDQLSSGRQDPPSGLLVERQF